MKNQMKGLADSVQQERAEKQNTASGIPIRAIVISLALIILFAVTNPMSQLYGTHAGIDMGGVPASGALLVPLLCVFVINPLLRKFRLRCIISAKEMVVIYGMTFIAGLIGSWGFFAYQVFSIMSIPKLVYIAGYKTVTPWMEQLSSWVLPKSRTAAMGFWMGRGSQVPWDEWIMPILVWTFFIALMSFMILCAVSIIRRHWTEREHLRYPIADIVVKMIEETEDSSIPPLYKNPLVWLGAILPIMLRGVNLLHSYFPAIPAINTSFPVYQYFKEEPFLTALSHYPTMLTFTIDPFLTGIAFLLPTQFTFSVWFFYLLHQVQLVVESSMGVLFYNQEYVQTAGAYMGIAILAFWYAKGEIKHAINRSFGRQKVEDDLDKNEALSYPVAFWGLLISIILFVIFSKVVMFAPISASLVLALSFIGCAVAIARIRAEAGLPVNMYGGPLYQVYMGTLGPKSTMEAYYFFRATYPYQFGSFLSIGALFLEQYKMGDEVGLKRRHVTYSLMFALIVGSIAAFAFGLPVIYKLGGFNAYDHLQILSGFGADVLSSGLAEQTRDLQYLVRYLIGGGLVVFLGYMQGRYIWWPFNPLGFAVSVTTSTWGLWSPIFVAWLVKWLVLRYGGPRVYRKAMPVAFGVIAGDILMRVISSIIFIVFAW